MQALRIIYEDEHLICVDKPRGFHSHPPEDLSIRFSRRWCALSILEKQLGKKLFPAHRLDRATSGLYLLAKNATTSAALHAQFRERRVEKRYACLLRGSLQGTAKINTALATEKGEAPQAAFTEAEEIFGFSLPIPGPLGENRRFTLAIATPTTGRYHQIRRHLAGLGLPLVGDSRHGDKKLNREFTALTGASGLWLRCIRLGLIHPASGAPLRLAARWAPPWPALFNLAGFCPLVRAWPSPGP